MMKVLLVLLLGLFQFAEAEEAKILRLLRKPGHVAVARHALAPGIGDPENFNLEDCATQRNLSPEGRAQARKMGELFREQTIQEARVFTSQWCRCRDTARLLKLGKPTELPALNSFFRQRNGREPQMRELRAWLQKRPRDKPVVLVTHQVVITALTGVFPASGEILVLKDEGNGEWSLIGRIRQGATRK